MKRYVVGFLFDAEERDVFLLRKTRPAWQVGKLNGIGGHVEAGESFEDAMERECREECGSAFGWELVAILSSEDHPKGTGEAWEMGCFRATAPPDFECPAASDVGECFERQPVTAITAAYVTTIPNLRWLIPMSLHTSAHDWPYRITERGRVPTTGDAP